MASFAPLSGSPGYRCIAPTPDGKFVPGDLVSLDHINPLPMSDIMIGVASPDGLVLEFDYLSFKHHFQPVAWDA